MLVLPAAVFACPNCVSSVEAASQSGTSGSMAGGLGGNMAAGYYYSILFMIGILFTLTTILVFAIRRQDTRLVPESFSDEDFPR